LDGIVEPKVEVASFSLRRYDGTTDIMDSGPRYVAPKEKEAAPETLVGFNAKKTLTEHDETCNVENRIGCEMMKMHTINKKDPMHKLMGGESQAAVEELHEHYLKARFGSQHGFIARHHDYRRRGEEAEGAKLLQIVSEEGRLCPSAGTVLLFRSIADSSAVAHGACRSTVNGARKVQDLQREKVIWISRPGTQGQPLI
jgi:hypothetical protein